MATKIRSCNFDELINLIIEKLYSITHVYEEQQDVVRLEILQYSIMKLNSIVDIDLNLCSLSIENPKVVIKSCIKELRSSKSITSCHDTIRTINKIIFYLQQVIKN